MSPAESRKAPWAQTFVCSILSYFDLYSEEHWLYPQQLIPEGMWSERTDGGVDVNLLTYPVLVEGYDYWKRRGAFMHPPEFIVWVDAKVQRLRQRIEASKKEGCMARPASSIHRTPEGSTRKQDIRPVVH